MSKKRKPFFQSGVFRALKLAVGFIPGVGPIAGELIKTLEGSQSVSEALEVINNSAIDGNTKIRLREIALEEQRLELEEERIDLEKFEIEVFDKSSAREREIEVLKNGGDNTLMHVLGWVVSIAFLAVVAVAIGFFPLPEHTDRELFYFGAGAVVSSFTMIMSYFWGSSRGSKDKSQLMAKK